MRLLLCCESYPPHRGGVQEVMRQIAERMAARGHDVTVATSRHPRRKSEVVNGVKIRAFKAGGKMVYGLRGQIDAYRDFVRTCGADAILVMAAQQWSFDALWPVLDGIKARKVFIPCGFSGLYDPDFADYFKALPDILKKFDHLVFNAEKYRDIDFARSIGLSNFTVLPNGISETDFDCEPDRQFRQRLEIPEDAFLFLTVGNPIEAKGHREVVDAFARLDTGGNSAVLLSVAGWPTSSASVGSQGRFANTAAGRVIETVLLEGFLGLYNKVYNSRVGAAARFADAAARRLLHIARTEGWDGLNQLVRRKLAGRGAPRLESIESMAAKASAQPFKRVILTDLPRPELVQAFMAADLFVFASRIEYSPLVLYEAAAAGTPFLTAPVGNADEIVRWTGGGRLCDASKDSIGYTRVDPQHLAEEMARCMRDRALLARQGATARERWRKYFTWQVVAGYYEDILSGKTPEVRVTDLQALDQLPVDQNGPAISSVA